MLMVVCSIVGSIVSRSRDYDFVSCSLGHENRKMLVVVVLLGSIVSRSRDYGFVSCSLGHENRNIFVGVCSNIRGPQSLGHETVVFVSCSLGHENRKLLIVVMILGRGGP